MSEYPRRPRNSRRSGARIIDTAEGVLVSLRRYRVDQAFVELMQTAKRHNVNPVSLADALVAIAEDQLVKDIDPAAATVALATWGHVLLRANGHDHARAEWLHGPPTETP
jgi:ANTAR domain